MKELLIATKNPGKFMEIKEVLGELNLKLLFLKDFDLEDGDFEENGDTFEDNAFLKASYYSKKTGIPAIGEDSGIIVDALPGELGVKTRRWGAGEHASDEEWIDVFFERMNGKENRIAHFVCNACFVDGEERFSVEGDVSGVITDGLCADIVPGIPLSSCFIPNGKDKVFSLLSEQEKNSLSHRGKAFFEMRDFLRSKLTN